MSDPRGTGGGHYCDYVTGGATRPWGASDGDQEGPLAFHYTASRSFGRQKQPIVPIETLRQCCAWLWQSSLVRFVAVGLSNTAVGLSVIYLCWRALGWSDISSNLTGYGAGLIWGFMMHRRWTFRSSAAIGPGFAGYAVVCAGAYGVNLGVVMLSRQLLGPTSFLPHVMGIVTYSALVYVACRLIVFHPEGGVRGKHGA